MFLQILLISTEPSGHRDWDDPEFWETHQKSVIWEINQRQIEQTQQIANKADTSVDLGVSKKTNKIAQVFHAKLRCELLLWKSSAKVEPPCKSCWTKLLRIPANFHERYEKYWCDCCWSDFFRFWKDFSPDGTEMARKYPPPHQFLQFWLKKDFLSENFLLHFNSRCCSEVVQRGVVNENRKLTKIEQKTQFTQIDQEAWRLPGSALEYYAKSSASTSSLVEASTDEIQNSRNLGRRQKSRKIASRKSSYLLIGLPRRKNKDVFVQPFRTILPSLSQIVEYQFSSILIRRSFWTRWNRAISLGTVKQF